MSGSATSGAAKTSAKSATPVLSIDAATLQFAGRTIWQDLSIDVAPHEFIAVIGSNGSGKSSLLKAILGQVELSKGQIKVDGRPVKAGHRKIGYIPQHRAVDAATPLRAKDLVRLGLDGHRFGLPLPNPRAKRRVAQMLTQVDAAHLSQKTVGQLSGGELQRLRVAQAVIGEPNLILADEPLSALDLHQQKVIADLINQERNQHNAAVLFVTHDVNPILEHVDRVLYLANGKFRIGTPDEVLRSEVLSELYGTPVDVLRNQGRIVVVGTAEHDHHPDEEWH